MAVDGGSCSPATAAAPAAPAALAASAAPSIDHDLGEHVLADWA
jgi:hypothetical protein